MVLEEPNETTDIPKLDVIGRKVSPISITPLGLINRMNKTEIMNRVAYITRDGDTANSISKK